MTPVAFIDFETESHCSLKDCGAYRYARDATTHPLLMAWRIGTTGESHLWQRTDKIPDEVYAHIRSGGTVAAWNIEFDRQIWNANWPYVPITVGQSLDVMAMAQAMGLPAGLAACGEALGISSDKQKMADGRALIRKFCVGESAPRQGADWRRFKDYCVQDVAAMVEIYTRLNPLPGSELKNMRLDMHINDNGVPLDTDGIEQAWLRAATVSAELQNRMVEITGYKPTQNVKLCAWLTERGSPCTSLAAGDVVEMLANTRLPDDVREVLKIRQLAAKSSVAKLTKMRAVAINGRAHGVHRYHAATTGRAGGRLIQTQNLPRPTLTQDEIRTQFDKGFKSANLSDISSCIRGMIHANRLVCSDWSNIEGRVAAWAVRENWKVKAFEDFDAGKGPDLYKVAASRIYGCEIADVTKAQRQVGKVSELACQYQGAVGAFQQMAQSYGVDIADDDALEAVQAWREAHPRIVNTWAGLERCATLALTVSGLAFGPFEKVGEHLYMTLPSGRKLCYPYARREIREDKYGRSKLGVTFYGQDTYTRKWGRTHTYGGKLFENFVQATARDILYHTLQKIHAQGHKVIMHVHDEIVVESDTLSLDALNKLLAETPPDWAKGLPLAAEGWCDDRYRK